MLQDIKILRFDVSTPNGTLQLNQTYANSVDGGQAHYLQRRPNLIRTPMNQLVSLAWGQIDPIPDRFGEDVKLIEINLQTSPPQITEEYIASGPIIDETLPIPFQYKNQHGIIMTCEPINTRVMAYRTIGIPIWKAIPTLTPHQPWRAAIDILEEDRLRPGRGIIALAFEGRVNNQVRTLLMIHGL